MRHGKRFNHLGRTSPHRKATLSSLASSLFLHKRINTTLAKAKALRQYVEPLITKAKNDTTHTRRVVFSYLQNKEGVKALYNEVVDRIGERPGGYTRIIKLGTRLGDNAEMAMIELVDFNDLLLEESKTTKTRTRRSRRRGKKSSSETTESREQASSKEEKDTSEDAGQQVKTVDKVDEEAGKSEKAIADDTQKPEKKKGEEAGVEESEEETKKEDTDKKEGEIKSEKVEKTDEAEAKDTQDKEKTEQTDKEEGKEKGNDKT